MQQGPYLALARQRDQFAVKGERNARRQAAAKQQPRGAVQALADYAFNPSQLSLGDLRAFLVQIDGESAPVRDSEVGSRFVLHRRRANLVATVAKMTLQAPSGLAATGKYRDGFAPERM